MPFVFWFPLVILPPPESCLVSSQYARKRPPTKTMISTICHEAFPECGWFRIGVAAQKLDDPRPVLHRWFASIFFPVSVGLLLQFEEFS